MDAGYDPSRGEVWIPGAVSGTEEDYRDLPCSSILCGGNLDINSTSEEILEVLSRFYEESSVDMVLFSDDVSGGDIASRFACRLGFISRRGVIAIEKKAEKLLLSCGVYHRNLTAVYKTVPIKLVLGITPGLWKGLDGFGRPLIKTINYVPEKPDFIENIIYEKYQESARLSDAKRLVVAGRGVGNKAAFAEIAAFAKLAGAEYGCSRPPAADGWTGYDRVIGMSGTGTKAELTDRKSVV
jgi:electron transfer flavoprotein alpha subunit